MSVAATKVGIRVAGSGQVLRNRVMARRALSVVTATDLHRAVHDLRTPLATVLQSIDALLELRDETSNRTQRTFDLLRRNVRWMGEVLEASIDHRLSREKGVDLVSLIEDTRSLIEPLLLAREQTATIEASPREIRVVADYGGIARVVLNLLDNASKYAPRGDALRVTIRQRSAGTVISVIDHGPGIPVGERHAIFRAFYRTESARRSDRPGVGLGLAVVQDVVAAHGGTVGVSRAAGATRVWFFLPTNTTTEGDES